MGTRNRVLQQAFSIRRGFRGMGRSIGMFHVSRIIGASVLALSMAGCGHSPGDRAVSGGLIGAGGGAALGAVAGFNPAVGALVGGAGGAAVGAATAPGR